MLIKLNLLVNQFKLKIHGVLHIGAHECEEQGDYLKEGISNDNIYWVEALAEKVELMKSRDSNLQIYQGVIDAEDDKTVSFNIADNGQSSSILEFGTHSHHHPLVKMIDKKQLKTIRLDTFIQKNNIPIDKLNFLNLDIQGKELDALKSMNDYLKHIDYIYTEVNSEYVYKNCALIPEIDEYLSKYGFIRVASKQAGNCGWGDALYIKR